MDSKSVKIVRLDIDEMDDFSGVDAIALVEEPAIESNFIYFSKQDQNKEVFESYSDYPDSVSNNAKRGIELNEKVNNKCATQVGKVRAQQLAKKEPISVETIKRMYSYLSRAEVNYDESDTEACGTISYLLWGGLACSPAKFWLTFPQRAQIHYKRTLGNRVVDGHDRCKLGLSYRVWVVVRVPNQLL